MRHTLKISVFIAVCSIFFAGCMSGNADMAARNINGIKASAYQRTVQGSISREISRDSRLLGRKHNRQISTLEKHGTRKIDIKPVPPEYNPVKGHKVSFSMVNTKLETVLYILADTLGMNIIMDRDFTAQNDLVTLKFHNVPAGKVLDELADKFDFYYQIDGNMIKINTFEERFFSLNFLDTNVAMNFDVGGDVLGRDKTETASGLAGNVAIKGKSAEKVNAYDLLSTMVTKVKSKNGIFSIDRLSGSLYIKDKPSVVRTVARLISDFKDALSRQILIDARIIEVTLSHGYEYGINWDVLRHEVPGRSTRIDHVAWNLSNGLVLSGVNSNFTLTTITNALQTFGDVKLISNPTIRAKHGRPAIISVGDSIAYKKSVTITRQQTASGASGDTDVEVEVSSVFDGLILGVIPFIEPNGRINLLINPIKSDVDTESINKLQDVGGGNTISLPKVGIKEISTTISLNSGDVVILGGLISTSKVQKNKGVPILSDIPVMGYMFKDKYMTEERKELVIVLKVDVL